MERRRKNSNGSISSPRTVSYNNNNNQNNNNNSYHNNSIRGAPKSGTSSRQTFHGVGEHGGGNNNVASPRPPMISRARSYAEGDSTSRTRSGSFSFRSNIGGSPASPALRRTSVRMTRRVKHVTFRNPLEEYEPSGNQDPSLADNDHSVMSSQQLDEELKKRQVVRKKRRQNRLDLKGDGNNGNGVSFFGLIFDGISLVATTSCTIC